MLELATVGPTRSVLGYLGLASADTRLATHHSPRVLTHIAAIERPPFMYDVPIECSRAKRQRRQHQQPQHGQHRRRSRGFSGTGDGGDGAADFAWGRSSDGDQSSVRSGFGPLPTRALSGDHGTGEAAAAWWEPSSHGSAPQPPQAPSRGVVVGGFEPFTSVGAVGAVAPAPGSNTSFDRLPRIASARSLTSIGRTESADSFAGSAMIPISAVVGGVGGGGGGSTGAGGHNTRRRRRRRRRRHARGASGGGFEMTVGGAAVGGYARSVSGRSASSHSSYDSVSTSTFTMTSATQTVTAGGRGGRLT